MNPKIELLLHAEKRHSRYFPRQLPQLKRRDLALFTSIMKRHQAPKGKILLGKGEVLEDFILIERGLVRQFYYKNNIDITEHFSCEGEYLVCIESLFLHSPTSLMVETLEPTTYYTVNYRDLEQLFESSPAILNLYRLLIEANLVLSQHKANEMRFESARDRYENFIRQFPEAAKRASGKHIASYLLMTPESLSRVKAGLL